MSSQADIVAAIKNNYDQLDDNFDTLYAKCATDSQKQQLRSLLASARDAFFAAAAKSLTDNNPTVVPLTQELKDTNDKLGRQLTNITDIVATLALCTEALELAASLAKLAASA
jgi:hypothetical protein